MFDFCPGDCTEPVDDEHETILLGRDTAVAESERWMAEHRVDWGAVELFDPPWRFGIFPNPSRGAGLRRPGLPGALAYLGREPLFVAEVGDTLCWDGTRVWLHSSSRQEVETCEAKEDRMLKFGTGQITAVAKDSEEGQLVRTAVALTEAERAGILAEDEEQESEGE
jgi:hypothetical protein